MHQYNLKSIEHLDEYIKLFRGIEDTVFVNLNQIECKDRELREADDWNDMLHTQFTEKHILPIQKLTLELATLYHDTLKELEILRNQYSQLIR
jgi:hypothetical protein